MQWGGQDEPFLHQRMPHQGLGQSETGPDDDGKVQVTGIQTIQKFKGYARHHLHLHLAKFILERRQNGAQQAGMSRSDGPDPEFTGLGGGIDGIGQRIGQSQNITSPGQHPPTGLIQHRRATRSGKQRRPELGFESFHLAADRRLRQPHMIPRCRKSAMAHHRHKGSQLNQHSSRSVLLRIEMYRFSLLSNPAIAASSPNRWTRP